MMFVTAPLLVDWCSNQVSFSLYHSMYMYIYVEWVTLVWCEREGSRVRSEHSDRVWKAGVRSVHTVSMTKTPRFEANHRVVRMHFHCDWHNVVIMCSLSLPVFYYRTCWSSYLLLAAIYTRVHTFLALFIAYSPAPVIPTQFDRVSIIFPQTNGHKRCKLLS